MLCLFFVVYGCGLDFEYDGWFKCFLNDFGLFVILCGGYLICEWYNGKYGILIWFEGLDCDNLNVFDCVIVIYLVVYVDFLMIVCFGKFGCSEGCFVMVLYDFNEVLWYFLGGCLFYVDCIEV